MPGKYGGPRDRSLTDDVVIFRGMWWMLFVAGASERRTPVVQAVEKATPSVVALEVEVPNQSAFVFFGAPGSSQSQGSGVIIDEQGIVLTNAHVVANAQSIVAHTIDGRAFEAHPVAIEVELDLAVLQLDEAKGLKAIEIADSSELLLGETAIAIGNPLGLGLTVSTGVVGSIGRQVEITPGIFQTYVQTDAAINPGNSGGALVDIEGRLIGVNTAIRADAEGIGFAIPANRARKIATDLLSYGEVRAPWLGCDFRDLQANARQSRLFRGALVVTDVHPRSPCATAKLEPGDVVFQVDGRQTGSRADLNAWLAEKAPGDRVVVEAIHADRPVVRELHTTALPEEAVKRALQRLGIEVRPVEGQRLAVVRASQDGSWVRSRLRAGDVILAVDGRRVGTETAFAEALRLAKARHQPSALFTVQRGRSRGHVTVEL